MSFRNPRATALLTSLLLAAAPLAAHAEPLKNIVLVHGAWVDASGWKPVADILTAQGFTFTMVQEPETSFADDVAATKRVLDLQNGPTLLVGHSRTTEIPGASHWVYESHAKEVAAVIANAANNAQK
jgi:pimeloyl-ACP methyl ester carboxylesterase